MTPDFNRTLKCAAHYRSLGLCPLPSRMDRKGPMLPTYADYYGPTPVPEHVYETWRTTNVQIICGVQSPTPTKIIVVDLDSDEAHHTWQRICAANGYVPGDTWMARTGGGGWHCYFRLPEGTSSCASGLLWGLWDTYGKEGKGGWAKHQEVRILGDNSLVVAPPSVHPKTGKRYEFGPAKNPNIYLLPELAPGWLLKMSRLVNPRFGAEQAPAAPRPTWMPSGTWYTRQEVLDAVGEQKFEIATREWGLVPACRSPNPSGWAVCYVPGREDPVRSHPSGSFNWRDGTLQDRKTLETISFFDLGVLLGKFQTWKECRDVLGDRFIGKRSKEVVYKNKF